MRKKYGKTTKRTNWNFHFKCIFSVCDFPKVEITLSRKYIFSVLFYKWLRRYLYKFKNKIICMRIVMWKTVFYTYTGSVRLLLEWSAMYGMDKCR